MFVIDVAIHIMDRKVAQGNAAARSLSFATTATPVLVHFMREHCNLHPEFPLPDC